ncbi:2-hydroxy-6-oxonona-2,4-dienedioate hydrolase [Frankia sp. EI5c]|uniref:alpha/beta fold hydrolase n=1 Tax=Frankia sp. EI5c TaxID=683316 RepID=UPI0007C2B300|nr:alpha/beta fold hydrolase [Frankia sp. EI5c]OAA18979.1 2-hydroxy-6-oxonona-2,4-dienedioate hydrolase [Frankia sp. EI5c]
MTVTTAATPEAWADDAFGLLAEAYAAGARVTRPVVGGVPTRLLEVGDPARPTVVFLHGTGGHLEAFAHVLAPFARWFHCVAYDLPGHGWSGPPAVTDGGYEVPAYTDHLDAVLDHLRVAPGGGGAALVGVSLGGWVAAHHAATRPGRVDALVLVAPGGVRADPAVMGALRSLSSAAVEAPGEAAVRTRLEWLVADPSTVTAALVATRLRLYQQPGAAERMAGLLCLQEPDVRRRNMISAAAAESIRAATLVLWGTKDPTGPAEAGADFARRVPGARFEALPELGHWPQFEDPAGFTALGTTFLRTAFERTAFERTAFEPPAVRSADAPADQPAHPAGPRNLKGV